MLLAFNRLVQLLNRLDTGLEELDVPADIRPVWVVRGLDFPHGDGIIRHVPLTAVDYDEWKVAEECADRYLAHVAELPYELCRGDVELSGFNARVASAVGND